MKLAFLISAHTDPEHLKRLIDSLPENSEFVIHIDQKSDISQFTRIIEGDHIHFLKHRVNVVWGSINEVEYQMELIREALLTDADYFITLSGMDYPVWSNEKMLSFFENADGKNYLQGICMTHQGKAADQYRSLRCFSSKPWKNGSMKSKMRVGLRKVISGLGIYKTLTIHTAEKEYNLYKGAAWWAIQPNLAQHILKQWDENEELKGYFKTSFCPAETFIQTVAFNSKYASSCILAEGKYQSLTALTPLTYIHYDPVIKIMEEEDYEKVIASGKMFCRKVISGKSEKFMDLIDNKRKQYD